MLLSSFTELPDTISFVGEISKFCVDELQNGQMLLNIGLWNVSFNMLIKRAFIFISKHIQQKLEAILENILWIIYILFLNIALIETFTKYPVDGKVLSVYKIKYLKLYIIQTFSRK